MHILIQGSLQVLKKLKRVEANEHNKPEGINNNIIYNSPKHYPTIDFTDLPLIKAILLVPDQINQYNIL